MLEVEVYRFSASVFSGSFKLLALEQASSFGASQHSACQIRQCCVPACKSGYSSTAKDDQSSISFYKFPTETVRRELWLRKIPRENLFVTPYSRVCSLHFTSDMFISLSTDSKKRRKTSDGIPLPCNGLD